MITVPRYERIGRIRLLGNRYTLTADWTWESALPPPGVGHACESGHVRIERTLAGCVIHIGAGFAWDGATLVPDFWAARKGSLVHDALYRELDAIVLFFECSVSEARLWADRVFTEVNRAFGLPAAIRRLYHRGVRWFGGIARRWSR